MLSTGYSRDVFDCSVTLYVFHRHVACANATFRVNSSILTGGLTLSFSGAPWHATEQYDCAPTRLKRHVFCHCSRWVRGGRSMQLLLWHCVENMCAVRGTISVRPSTHQPVLLICRDLKSIPLYPILLGDKPVDGTSEPSRQFALS